MGLLLSYNRLWTKTKIITNTIDLQKQFSWTWNVKLKFVFHFFLIQLFTRQKIFDIDKFESWTEVLNTISKELAEREKAYY